VRTSGDAGPRCSRLRTGSKSSVLGNTQRFAENEISFAILPDLSDQDLKELGMSAFSTYAMSALMSAFGVEAVPLWNGIRAPRLGWMSAWKQSSAIAEAVGAFPNKRHTDQILETDYESAGQEVESLRARQQTKSIAWPTIWRHWRQTDPQTDFQPEIRVPAMLC
jgi:hypothetical protein